MAQAITTSVSRKKERLFLLLVSVLLGLLFLRFYQVSQQSFADVDKRLQDGTMVNLNTKDAAGKFKQLLQKGFYFDDPKDIELIGNVVAKQMTGTAFDNIGDLNKSKYNIDADEAFDAGGQSFKDRVLVSRALLGYTGNDSSRFLQEKNNPPQLPEQTAIGLSGYSIKGEVLDKGSPAGGVLIRLQMIIPQDSTFNDEETDQSFSVFEWLSSHHDELAEEGFEIEQPEGQKRYVFGNTKIDLEVKENNDWFDIYAVVYFGHFRIPFIQLKNHILNHKKEFTLPSGEIAIIPEKWFSQYGNLLHFSEGGDQLKLRRHHIGLVNNLAESELADITMSRKLQKLTDFEALEEVALPQHFKGNLRPYQKAGYNWFHFLQQYHFGGCLADDMGLGKTIQALALLQKRKEDNEAINSTGTSLLIMPTSLIYNWLNEAKKFTPKLRLMVHTGTLRYKSPEVFSNYDVIITTYGISRIDIDLLKSFYFDYVILDESQNIKNPSSKSYQCVRQLKSRFKLILSGTPVENSVNDLWTQMSFINPGLLGIQQYFQNEFVTPIEKKKDEDKARRLQALIKPFVLRRTKEQVATELPPKTESLFYCQMSDEQASVYEKVKSEYRNELLKSLEDGTYAKTQIQVLQGLIKLRQIANHPAMIDADYEGDSGKFENVVHTLANVLDGGHKVLIFSQFVKQLTIYRNYFDEQDIAYAYLDGSTQNRGDVVKRFQEDTKTKVFLISIKAGGVGLNLTEADYVFILDPWWNPAVEQQAIDRTHRIGQTKNVFIYKFITKDTVEEKILALQQRKLSVARALITTEESFIKSLSADDIKEILR